VPAAILAPLLLVLLFDGILAALPLTSAPDCAACAVCAGGTRWHFVGATVTAALGLVLTVVAAWRRQPRATQWSIAAATILAAAWPVVWVLALGQQP
jgi:hypothetical protein